MSVLVHSVMSIEKGSCAEYNLRGHCSLSVWIVIMQILFIREMTEIEASESFVHDSAIGTPVLGTRFECYI